MRGIGFYKNLRERIIGSPEERSWKTFMKAYGDFERKIGVCEKTGQKSYDGDVQWQVATLIKAAKAAMDADPVAAIPFIEGVQTHLTRVFGKSYADPYGHRDALLKLRDNAAQSVKRRIGFGLLGRGGAGPLSTGETLDKTYICSQTLRNLKRWAMRRQGPQ
jgi:hypothetical protein